MRPDDRGADLRRDGFGPPWRAIRQRQLHPVGGEHPRQRGAHMADAVDHDVSAREPSAVAVELTHHCPHRGAHTHGGHR